MSLKLPFDTSAMSEPLALLGCRREAARSRANRVEREKLADVVTYQQSVGLRLDTMEGLWKLFVYTIACGMFLYVLNACRYI